MDTQDSNDKLSEAFLIDYVDSNERQKSRRKIPVFSPGKQFNRYRMIERIGQEGMGLLEHCKQI